MNRSAAADRRRAFTLMELLVVVVILGILAAVVTASFRDAGVDARKAAFVKNLRSFAEASELVFAETGQYPSDGDSGALPPELAPYIKADDWERITPIGGVWDSERNSSGVTFAVGVHFNGQGETRDDEFMTEVDELFDDGDLDSGVFRKIASDRYYWVLAP